MQKNPKKQQQRLQFGRDFGRAVDAGRALGRHVDARPGTRAAYSHGIPTSDADDSRPANAHEHDAPGKLDVIHSVNNIHEHDGLLVVCRGKFFQWNDGFL